MDASPRVWDGCHAPQEAQVTRACRQSVGYFGGLFFRLRPTQLPQTDANACNFSGRNRHNCGDINKITKHLNKIFKYQ
jgi:hypothetical protein